MLASTVVVNVCTAGKPCDVAAASGALLMNLTTAITDADAKAIFSPLSSIKILEFSSMLGVFAGFADEADKERFYRRVKDYAGIWCCIQAHPVRRWRARLRRAVRTRPVRSLTLAVHRATSGTICCSTCRTWTATTAPSTAACSRC